LVGVRDDLLFSRVSMRMTAAGQCLTVIPSKTSKKLDARQRFCGWLLGHTLPSPETAAPV
ncbi:MAG: hypothetical protein O6950_06655, partial [Gammaproteobacteria bacterium]|nr:hypothetical protein [Gammaproteobacteria bacterium]